MMRDFRLCIALVGLVSILPKMISSKVLELDDSDTEQLFEGHWVVLFYAPWCPACTTMKSRWMELADSPLIDDLKIAQIDVHEYPALSGQFLIFNLPTIYYIDEGSCKEYVGIHEVSAIKSWLADGTAKSTDPISSWRSPNSLMLRGVGRFFHFANNIRTLKNSLTIEYGIPSWMAYAIFVCITILIGGMVGLTIVCICDVLFPPKPSIINDEDRNQATPENREQKSKKNKTVKADNAEQESGEEASGEEEEDKTETEEAAAAASADVSPDDKNKQVRKRKSKK